MNVVFKIFLIKEISVKDHWDGVYVSAFVLIEGLSTEFQSQESASVFLKEEIEGGAKGEYVIQKIFK